MRKRFFKQLHKDMENHKALFCLSGDLGYGGFNNIRKDYPKRFLNVGAAEQALVGVGIGLSYEGFTPICYSITPFILFRAAELLRIYLNHEKANVKLVGSGRGKDYAHDGFTHDCSDDLDLLNAFPNIRRFIPKDEEEMLAMLPDFLYNVEPAYLNLKR